MEGGWAGTPIVFELEKLAFAQRNRRRRDSGHSHRCLLVSYLANGSYRGGIAIEYALLVVVRWREERQLPNVTNEAAVRNAMQHAGSAVVFSGTTVAISLRAPRLAGAVHAHHRHRRPADRAGQRRRGCHAARAMPGWKSDVGRRIDEITVRTVPGVRKAVKWNTPLYGVEGQG